MVSPSPRAALSAPVLGPRLCALVALSGTASLIYELLWIRALGLHFGTTTPAITTVVATFMAGLGLGNLWFGKRADRSLLPFVLYRRLELSIACLGLAASLLLLRAGSWLDTLAQLCAAAGPLATAVRACVFSLVLLAPATAMGGTLPVLARALSEPTRPGRALGLLYACNTLGAIAGSLLPDFVLIPRYGLTVTACVAVASNLLIGFAVPYLNSATPLPAIETAARASRPQLAALAISVCSGFCALGLEVLWSRTLQHWAAALVTSFAVLLASYLAALSLGSLVAQGFADRSRQPLRAAVVLLGASALCALAPVLASPSWRDLERALWPRPAGLRRLGLLREAVDALLHATYLEAATCLVLGAIFPFVAAAWLSDGKPGTRTGQLFVANTLGGVLGAIVVGFVWLPMFGEQASYCAVALLLASVAALTAWLLPRSSAERSARAATLACLVVVLGLIAWLPNRQLFRAHFRSGGQLVAVQEGATTTAAVAERFVYGEAYYRELLTPGVSMSSTRADARRYMSVMAHAALLTARGAERALLICYGVGNTAAALLSDQRLQRLDVVDISPEVLALGPEFDAARSTAPLYDPRTHVFVDDGRHHLITQEARYDVITAEPPPPNYAGVVNLYSREFYRLAKRRLAAGGVITQWLPVFQLSDNDVRAMIAAFVSEFPHTALLYGYEQQLILIGSLRPLAVTAARSAEVALSRQLPASYVGSVDDLLGSVVQTDAELRRSVQGVAPLSDERPTIQYPDEALSEQTFYTQSFQHDSARASTLLRGSDASQRARVQAAWGAMDRALTALPLFASSPAELRELRSGRWLWPALQARPDDEGLWALLAVDSDRVRLAKSALQRAGASALLAQPRRVLEATSKLPRYLALQDALWVLARRAFYAHDYAGSLTLLGQISPEADRAAQHALFRAGCLRALGQTESSVVAFDTAAAISGEDAFRIEMRLLAKQAAQPTAASECPWSQPLAR